MVSTNPEGSAVLDSRAAGALLMNLFDTEPDAGLPHIGEYVLDGAIGEGGAGVVYRGLRRGSDRALAIKVLRRPFSSPAEARRAWRELDLLGQLHLPSVPHLYDYGLHEGRLFMVSEQIDGRPLDTHCDEHGLGRRERVELLVRVCTAVERLHERGVLHRDLKPDNILVGPDGQPVVVDLGIATAIDEVAEGTGIGTLTFMAPEQARGEVTLTTRCDVYGLGATAWSVLCGGPPHAFEDRTVAEALGDLRAGLCARRVRTLDPSCPRALAAILERAVAASPDDRFANVAEFRRDLERWLRGEPVDSAPVGNVVRFGMLMRRHPWVTAVVVAAVLIMGGAVHGATKTSVYTQLKQEALRSWGEAMSSREWWWANGFLAYAEAFDGVQVDGEPNVDAMRARLAWQVMRSVLDADRRGLTDEMVVAEGTALLVRGMRPDPRVDSYLDQGMREELRKVSPLNADRVDGQLGTERAR